jgi:hypothetical protein
MKAIIKYLIKYYTKGIMNITLLGLRALVNPFIFTEESSLAERQEARDACDFVITSLLTRIPWSEIIDRGKLKGWIIEPGVIARVADHLIHERSLGLTQDFFINDLAKETLPITEGFCESTDTPVILEDVTDSDFNDEERFYISDEISNSDFMEIVSERSYFMEIILRQRQNRSQQFTSPAREIPRPSTTQDNTSLKQEVCLTEDSTNVNQAPVISDDTLANASVVQNNSMDITPKPLSDDFDQLLGDSSDPILFSGILIIFIFIGIIYLKLKQSNKKKLLR